MISTRCLTFQYDEKSTFSFQDVSCEVGEALLILGPSGSGKTTLLHLLAGILVPSNGNVQISGVNLSLLSSKQLDIFRGENIGLVFQKHHFLSSLTMMENLLLPAAMTGKQVDQKWTNRLIDDLGIGSVMHKKARTLSEGELQRTAIARAAVLKPKVLLADEPSSSLDDNNCEKVIAILKEISSLSGSALVIVTHDRRLKSSFKDSIEINRK